MTSYLEAVAHVTGHGQRFETAPIEVDGVVVTAFANAPGSLRQLFDAARGHGDATFLVYEDERWSFIDVMAQVDAFAVALVERYGIERGDRVAIAMRNYPEWVIAFAAITSIGAVSVSFNAWWVTDEIEFALRDAGVSVVVADSERVERCLGPCRELGVRIIAVRAEETPEGVDAWPEIVVAGSTMPAVDVDGEDDATILYTSGTTGRPKGAVSTHRSIIQALLGFACRAAVDKARAEPMDGSSPVAPKGGAPLPPAFILVVPLFHVTGCVPVMLGCFAGGTKLVMMRRWDPERALELIERERVTQFVGVPTQSWDLLECPAFERHDTSSLERVGGGGAPAPPALVRRVDNGFRRGSPSIGYGMTETNAYGPQNSGHDYMTHPTSTGRATPIVEIEIRDGEGAALACGERGEIWFKGPHLFRGYWNNPAATAATIVHGWLRTGDIGRIDDEGFLYIEDRAKDMVLRAGENVYCAEVEAAIYEHPAVYEAAVYGLPHERLGEEVVATVRVKPELTLAPEELVAYLGEHLASFKIPTQLEIVTEPLPRNASGKILKTALRDAHIKDRGSPSP